MIVYAKLASRQYWQNCIYDKLRQIWLRQKNANRAVVAVLFLPASSRGREINRTVIWNIPERKNLQFYICACVPYVWTVDRGSSARSQICRNLSYFVVFVESHDFLVLQANFCRYRCDGAVKSTPHRFYLVSIWTNCAFVRRVLGSDARRNSDGLQRKFVVICRNLS